MCEMNVKGALSETVAGTKWLQYTQRAVIVAVILQSYSIVPPEGEKKDGLSNLSEKSSDCFSWLLVYFCS